jgi:hypothetical protein
MLEGESLSVAEGQSWSELCDQIVVAWERFCEAWRPAFRAFIDAIQPVFVTMRRVQLADSLTPYVGERVADWLAFRCPERWLPQARWWTETG